MCVCVFFLNLIFFIVFFFFFKIQVQHLFAEHKVSQISTYKGIKDAHKKFDRNNDGEISWSEFVQVMNEADHAEDLEVGVCSLSIEILFCFCSCF